LSPLILIFQRSHQVSVELRRRWNFLTTKHPLPISLLSNCCKVFKFIVHGHIYHYLNSKIRLYQHGFSKTKSTSTNLVTYVDFISPLVGYQRQVDAIYFDLSNAFDRVSHSLLLHKLSAFGPSGGYVNWFRTYLSNQKSQVRVSGVFPRILKFSPVFPRDLCWDPFSSMCSLTTYAMQLLTLSIYFLLTTSNLPSR
jgi:hypothetical protein